MTTLFPPNLPDNTAPPPDLHLELVIDPDGNSLAARRPSTSSLSRFRSCPQLASVVDGSQDSPNSDMSPLLDADGHLMHVTPQTRPTPTPSPPGSPTGNRPRWPTLSDAGSFCSTPKLGRPRRLEPEPLARTFSYDSPAEAMGDPGLFKEGAFLALEDLGRPDTGSNRNTLYDDGVEDSGEERVSETEDGGSSLHVRGQRLRRHGGHVQAVDHDCVDKCSRWLQSLKLTKADKMKSRSHVQLPPV